MGFAADGWSSRAKERYIGLLNHYADEDFEKKKFMLKCDDVDNDKRHTGQNISEFLNKTLDEWNLNSNTITKFFVTDNGPDIKLAIQLNPDWIWISCFNHNLNLVVTDAVKVKHRALYSSLSSISIKITKHNNNFNFRSQSLTVF